jgi:MoxR-like ATPase
MNLWIPVEDTTPYVPRTIKGKRDTAIIEGAYDARVPALLVGSTGTGKTKAIRHLCARRGLPYVRLSLHEGVTADDLLGQWQSDGKGAFVYREAPLLLAMRHGGVVVFDEANMASGSVLSVLHGILDDERAVTIDAIGERVKAHPDFWACCTINPDDKGSYEGTKRLNDAFKDRFEIILEYDYSRAVDKSIVGDDVMLLEVADKLRALYDKGEISTPFSTRALKAFVANTARFGRDVAVEILLNRFGSADRTTAKALLELLKDSRAAAPARTSAKSGSA